MSNPACADCKTAYGPQCYEHDLQIQENNGARTDLASGVKTPVPENVYSVFIPWVEEWVTTGMVRKELGECGWGEIEKVDFLFSAHKRKHYKVYVHFKSVQDDVRAHLDSGKNVKVYYNGTYYWKVSKSQYVHKEKETKLDKKYELSE